MSTRNMRPGSRRPLCSDVPGLDVQHPGLGSHDDETVLGHRVARGPQPVAVQHRADAAPVGERDRGRAVPRLHEAGVVLVERLLRVAHRRVVLPRLGDQHHHRVRQRAPAVLEQLHRVVEHGRVAGARAWRPGRSSRCRRRRPVGLEQALPRVHPVDVAAQRVDLPVVAEEAERLRQAPTWETCSCCNAGAPGPARSPSTGSRQVGVERLDLLGQQQALVDQRPRTRGWAGGTSRAPGGRSRARRARAPCGSRRASARNAGRRRARRPARRRPGARPAPPAARSRRGTPRGRARRASRAAAGLPRGRPLRPSPRTTRRWPGSRGRNTRPAP